MKFAEKLLRKFISNELLSESLTKDEVEYFKSAFRRADDLRLKARLFLKNVDTLKQNYPEIYSSIEKSQPDFIKGEKAVRHALAKLESDDGRTAFEIIFTIDVYNDATSDVNSSLDNIESGETLTPEQEKFLADFAFNVYEALFPETYVSKFVRWSTGQSSLEDYQQWLIAPGEGIESAITNVFSLFDPQTWTNAALGVQTLYEMTPEERSAAATALKLAWDKISPGRFARDAVRWLVSVVAVCGGAAKLANMTGLVFSSQVLELLYVLRNLEKLRALPASVIAGLRLDPVK